MKLAKTLQIPSFWLKNRNYILEYNLLCRSHHLFHVRNLNICHPVDSSSLKKAVQLTSLGLIYASSRSV